MYLVLLTGGLASGKDTVADRLEELGATVIDLDLIAKEEQVKEDVLEKLRLGFGDDIVDPEHGLNRGLLAQRAFASKEAADKLNGICWPPVKARINKYLHEAAENEDTGALLVLLIPLLAEAPDYLEIKDEVIAVVADEELRLKRAIQRGMSPKDAKNRMKLQASDEKRISISDTVLTNNGSIEELRGQVDSWHRARKEGGVF